MGVDPANSNFQRYSSYLSTVWGRGTLIWDEVKWGQVTRSQLDKGKKHEVGKDSFYSITEMTIGFLYN